MFLSVTVYEKVHAPLRYAPGESCVLLGESEAEEGEPRCELMADNTVLPIDEPRKPHETSRDCRSCSGFRIP